MRCATPYAVFFVALVCLPTLLARAADDTPSNAPVPDGTRITGRVTDTDGAPVAAAQVALLRRGTYSGYTVEPRTTTTDANGGFAFDGVAAGEFRIWGGKKNLTSRDDQMMGTIIKVDPKTEPVMITLRAARSILVTVVSAADNAPISGATVRPGHVYGYPNITTGADGRAVVNGITGQNHELEVIAPGKARVTKSVDLTGTEQVSVEFALPEGGALNGVITDTKHAPLKGIGVNVYLGDGGNPLDYVTSGADGSYVVDHLPVDQPLRALFSSDTHPNIWENFEIGSSKRTAELNAQMAPNPPGGSITGTVTDPGGNPVAGVKVIFYGPSSRSQVSATTHDDGTYRLDGMQIRQGIPNQIIVRAKGWAPVAISVEPGTKDEPAEVNAQLNEKGHTIHGVVVNSKQDPIPGVYVMAGGRTTMDSRAETVTTDANGHFEFDSLPAKATFEISAQGYTGINWKELPLDEADDVTVELQPMASIVGKVIDADSSQPIPKFNVRMRTNNMSTRRLAQGDDFSNADGGFRLRELRSDVMMTLVISAPGYPAQYFEGIATTNDEQAEPVELKLSKHPADHMRIAGRIVDSNSKPLVGVDVRAVIYAPPDGSRQMPREIRFNWGMLKSGQLAIQQYIRSIESQRTDADGRFVFESLPGPEIDLAYWSSSVPPTRMQNVATLPEEQREHLEISVPAAASLSGKIDRQTYPTLSRLTVRPRGDPTSDVDVQLKENATEFKIPALAAGAYEIQLWGKPLPNPDGTFQYEQLPTQTVELKEGEAGKLDLGQADSTPASATPGK